MRVLLYGSDHVWDASTPELEKKAFKALFKMLDEKNFGGSKLFDFNDHYSTYSKHPKYREAYIAAKNGDVESIKLLINQTYVPWHLLNVHKP